MNDKKIEGNVSNTKNTYSMENGILHCDGKPIIALGVSYYASFHESKFPVPPEGDRLGEMRKDIQRIKEAGFQQIRLAALGDITIEDDGVKIDSPLIDATVEEAAKEGLTTSIRLQGYVMNLHGYDDYIMLDRHNKPMRCGWSDFLRSSLFHEGVMEDNRIASRSLAAHFANKPELLSFQIYNEPHYPSDGIYDYHPLTIAAYKKWLTEQGFPEQEPPRELPKGDDRAEIDAWVRWREFNNAALDKFMEDSALAAKEGAPHIVTYTNIAGGSVLRDGAAMSGVNYFKNARGVSDIVGITSYVHLEGGDVYHSLAQYAMAESAAALSGKRAWNMEVDARTRMPQRKLHQEVYAQLAAGFKGLNFYEWRGDYPDPGSPNPDNCGFIFSDGSKTEHYDHSMKMIRFVNRYSDLFVNAEKIREGVAVLYSEYGSLYSEGSLGGHTVSLYIRQLMRTYRELRRAGICADFVESSDLKENKFGVRLLFVPAVQDNLSQKEREEIDAFVQSGGKVWYLNQSGTFGAFVDDGWWAWDLPRLDTTRLEFRGLLEPEDILEQCEITPTARTNNRHLLAGAQIGDGYSLIYLINSDPARKNICGATLMTTLPFTEATLLRPEGETSLKSENGTIELPDLDEGGVVLLK